MDKTDLYHTEDFKKFLTVQKNLSERTIENHLMNANVYYRSKLSIQDFLINVKNTRTAATYKNYLATLKILYRDYLKKPDMIADFKFPKQQYKPKIIPSKPNLKIYYDALPSNREKVIFLLLASSGLRISEALTLKPEEIDFENKMIIPNVHNGQTKQSWITFYNSEVNLREYIPFNISIKRIQVLFKETAVKIGMDISAHTLRSVFAREMSKSGVQDRYIDAFCGRIPQSVLARHYSDYSPEVLKEIYDKANIKILV